MHEDSLAVWYPQEGSPSNSQTQTQRKGKSSRSSSDASASPSDFKVTVMDGVSYELWKGLKGEDIWWDPELKDEVTSKRMLRRRDGTACARPEKGDQAHGILTWMTPEVNSIRITSISSRRKNEKPTVSHYLSAFGPDATRNRESFNAKLDSAVEDMPRTAFGAYIKDWPNNRLALSTALWKAAQYSTYPKPARRCEMAQQLSNNCAVLQEYADKLDRAISSLGQATHQEDLEHTSKHLESVSQKIRSMLNVMGGTSGYLHGELERDEELKKQAVENEETMIGQYRSEAAEIQVSNTAIGRAPTTDLVARSKNGRSNPGEDLRTGNTMTERSSTDLPVRSSVDESDTGENIRTERTKTVRAPTGERGSRGSSSAFTRPRRSTKDGSSIKRGTNSENHEGETSKPTSKPTSKAKEPTSKAKGSKRQSGFNFFGA